MRAMILAAGKGTRMGALTATKPKPLLEVQGESLIERHVRRLGAAGIDEIVINTSYLADQIRELLGTGHSLGVSIEYSHEPGEPLETAGGIIQALPLLGTEPFLVINADVVSDFDFAALAALDKANSLVLVPNPPHHPAGDYGLDRSSLITRDSPKLTFAGISCLSPDLFDGLTAGPRALASVFDSAIANRALKGLFHPGLWIDVGTPERLEQARQALVSGGRV